MSGRLKKTKNFFSGIDRVKADNYNTFNTRGDEKDDYAEQSRRVGRIPVRCG